jgi:hypothetical protein
MGIQDSERRKAQQQVRQHRDSAESVVLRHLLASPSPSPNDGSITRNTEDYNTKGLRKKYSEYEIVKSQALAAGTAIQATDERLEIAQLDLENATLEPRPGDSVIRGSETWAVISVGQDTHRAWWYLQLRRPG